jgi:hypothetical protein
LVKPILKIFHEQLKEYFGNLDCDILLPQFIYGNLQNDNSESVISRAESFPMMPDNDVNE